MHNLLTVLKSLKNWQQLKGNLQGAWKVLFTCNWFIWSHKELIRFPTKLDFGHLNPASWGSFPLSREQTGPQVILPPPSLHCFSFFNFSSSSHYHIWVLTSGGNLSLDQRPGQNPNPQRPDQHPKHLRPYQHPELQRPGQLPEKSCKKFLPHQKPCQQMNPSGALARLEAIHIYTQIFSLKLGQKHPVWSETIQDISSQHRQKASTQPQATESRGPERTETKVENTHPMKTNPEIGAYTYNYSEFRCLNVKTQTMTGQYIITRVHPSECRNISTFQTFLQGLENILYWSFILLAFFTWEISMCTSVVSSLSVMDRDGWGRMYVVVGWA